MFSNIEKRARGVNRGEQGLIRGKGVGWGSVNRGEQGLIRGKGVGWGAGLNKGGGGWGGDQLIEESGAYKGKGGGLNKAFTVNSI